MTASVCVRSPMNSGEGEPRLTGMRRVRLHATAFALVALLLAGCGEVVLGFTSGPVAALRLEGTVTVVRHANGDQEVRGAVVNVGDRVADQVEATLTLYVLDAFGHVIPWETVTPPVPVFDDLFGTQTLHPGERGTFAVLLPGRPPIVRVDVDLGARFPSDGFLFFFFSPGLVIITA